MNSIHSQLKSHILEKELVGSWVNKALVERISFPQNRHLPLLTKKAPESLKLKIIAPTSFRSSRRRRKLRRSSTKESQRRGR
jgi:hypothetical protein